ncbi:pyruvate kinase [Oscillibacter sp. PC13]|uniref:pyruvate kinase n=1 Tax=Oscillibacter sp. PC13 TaxID=1855299 RepID=UPI0008E26479|nr:pyruvate kinase [Oscillibacter sp. PC13]SFO95394.1 pyruvate kinase [Oscillibacter sp. PC13]
MRKTKIVCTLGPATDQNGILKKMLQAGMNVARFNFSHGSHTEHKSRLDQLKALRTEMNLPVAAMLDTKGPEIRLKSFAAGSVMLRAGNSFTLTTEDTVGDETRCAVTYAELPQDVKAGDTILLDDGLVRLTVEETTASAVRCRVENDGVMKNNKGVNIPGVRLSMPYMSQRDREDILFGVEQGFDYIAASFVRTAADVREIRRLLDKAGSNIRIIAKIENREGVSNLSEILSVADGVMVARGDMGVEIDFTEIPVIQKDMIAQCVALGKPVITATQMLDSMIENPRPTRAEITDVANAIYDGTSAIMLSGETAAGKYPVEAVKTMDAIALRTESDINYAKRMRAVAGKNRMSIAAATAHAACTTAMDIGADAILTVSQSGTTARLVSRFRPGTTVVACLLNEQVQRQMALYWGVTPLLMPYASNTDELIEFAVQASEQAGLVKQGDLVVVTAGVPVGVPGTTNMIKVHLVGGALLNAVGIGESNASGPLCVCRSLEEVHAKFRPGDVLVVPYTSNEILPQIRQAAAVISEESGVNSHAATVGLTLNKAVIVGAGGATANLRDGTLVSVDCTRGVVQTMPQ